MNRMILGKSKHSDRKGSGSIEVNYGRVSTWSERQDGVFATIAGDSPVRELARHEESSVDLLYCGGVLHCVPRREADDFAAACLRVLKPLGTVRITTIDLDEIVHGYLFDWADERGGPVSRTQKLNAAFRRPAVQFIYGEEELTDLLVRAGFGDIRRFGIGASSNQRFWNLESDRACALILEATKP